MTAAELRQALEGIRDDAEVFGLYDGATAWGRVTKAAPHPVDGPDAGVELWLEIT